MNHQQAIRNARLHHQQPTGFNAAARRHDGQYPVIERVLSGLQIAVFFGAVAWIVLLSHASAVTVSP